MNRLGSERRGSSLLLLGLFSLLLGNSLGKQLGVLGGSVLLGLSVLLLLLDQLLLVGDSSGGDKSLDLGGLGVGLAGLGGHLSSNDILSHVVLLGEGKQLSDVVGSLGAESSGDGLVGEALNLGVTLLDNGQRQGRQVVGDNAASDGCSLSLTVSSGSVARVALGQQESHSGGVHDTLLHGETLLVVAAGNLEDVALELVTEEVGVDLLAHSLLVEASESVLVLNVDALLGALSGVCDVELR